MFAAKTSSLGWAASAVVHAVLLVIPIQSAPLVKPHNVTESLKLIWTPDQAELASPLEGERPETEAAGVKAAGLHDARVMPEVSQDPMAPGRDAGTGTDAETGADMTESREAVTVEEIPPAGTVVSSDQVLRDPETAADFTRYLNGMKEKIRHVAERFRKFVSNEWGSVNIDFVLDREGRVIAIHTEVLAGFSHELVAKRGREIIEKSAPFGPFPVSVKPDQVLFNIQLDFRGEG